MRRVALDTNVLLAAVIARGLCADLVTYLLRAHCDQRLDVIVPAYAFEELNRHLRGKFAVPPAHVKSVNDTFALFRVSEHMQMPSITTPDPDDVAIVGQALWAGSEGLITGDKALLALHRVDGMVILSPRDAFMQLRVPPVSSDDAS